MQSSCCRTIALALVTVVFMFHDVTPGGFGSEGGRADRLCSIAECSETSFFNRLSAEWINQTSANDGSGQGYILIKMTKDWELHSAHVHAPRGSRLGEQLVRQSGGSIDLDLLGSCPSFG